MTVMAATRRRRGGQPAEKQIVLRDPRAIRALAHPARLAVIEALLRGEELTATECASLTGLSPSATNYHLKTLERWGLVEPGGRRPDGRDRPWRATGTSLMVDSTLAEGTFVAESALVGRFLDRQREIVMEFLQRQGSEPNEWRDAMTLVSHDYWMTPGEVRAVLSAVEELLGPYRSRRNEEPQHGRRLVRFSTLSVPRADLSPPP